MCRFLTPVLNTLPFGVSTYERFIVQLPIGRSSYDTVNWKMVMVLMIGFAFEIGNPLTFGVSAKIRQDFAEVKKGVLKQLVLNPTRLCYIYDIRKTTGRTEKMDTSMPLRARHGRIIQALRWRIANSSNRFHAQRDIILRTTPHGYTMSTLHLLEIFEIFVFNLPVSRF